MSNSKSSQVCYISAKEAKKSFPEQYKTVLKYDITIFTPSVKMNLPFKILEDYYNKSVDSCSPVELSYVDEHKLKISFSIF